MEIALYARVSSDRQEVDLSISAQLKALREYASRQGHTVVHEYVDEAESGRSMQRPGFGAMISVARQKVPSFESILVWKLSRFARDRKDSIVYKALLRKHGVQVISINEQLDDTPTGRLLEGIIECLDEYYSLNLGQEVQRGMRESASRGNYVSAWAPYGYRRIKVKQDGRERPKLEIDPHTSPVVARIFRDFLGGSGLKEITIALNRDGVSAPRSGRWGKTTIHTILKNQTYTGNLVWGKKNKQKLAPICVEGAWEAIVDKATFDQVQQMLAQRATANFHPRRTSSRHLLSGLALCGYCGKAMVCQDAKSGKFHYYVCGTLLKQGAGSCPAPYLNSDKLDQMVLEKIRDRILSEENLRELVRMINEDMGASSVISTERLETVNEELADVRRRLDRLYDALETGRVTLSDLAPRIQALRHRQDQLEAARYDVERALAARHIELADDRLIRGHIRNLREILSSGQLGQQRAFIRSFVKDLKLTKGKAHLTYTLPLPPEGTVEEGMGVLGIVHYGGR